jgi:hypothetical protein
VRPSRLAAFSAHTSPGSTSLGICFASYRDALITRIVADKIDHIAVESVFVSTDRITALERLYGLKAITWEVAYRKNLAVNEVTASQWREHFLGDAKPPRELSKEKRRKWLNKQTRDECESRNWHVQTDDEADALGILVYERARLFPEWGVTGGLFGNAI